MAIEIPVGPLSVNKSSRGPKIKSAEYLKFEQDVSLLLPFNKGHAPEGELFVLYIFYIKNYGKADEDNCKKIIQDILVKRGYFIDDRYIKASYSEKRRVQEYKDEKIIIDIVLYDKRHELLSVL